MFSRIIAILLSTSGPIYCSRCGYANPPGSTFCADCRAMLNP